MSSQTERCLWQWIRKKVNLFVSFLISTIKVLKFTPCLNTVPGTFSRFFPHPEMEAWHQINVKKLTNKHNEINENDPIRNPRNWEARMVATNETSGWRREGAATQSWMHTSRIWHQKREVSNWVRLYTKMLFWSQNQVQTKRFPVSVCKKHGILLTSDLFEAKPCEHVAVPWHHLTPSTKPMQNPPPSKAPEVSWYQPWHLDTPTSFWNLSRVQSISYVSICFTVMVSMDLKIQSNISVFLTNPYKSLQPVQLHQHVDFNFPLWPAGSRSILGTSGPWLRPECEIWWWVMKACFRIKQRSSSGWKLKTKYHRKSIRVQKLNRDKPWKDIRTNLLQTISIFLRCLNSMQPATKPLSWKLHLPTYKSWTQMDSLWTSPFVEWCEISWNIWDLCFGEHNSIGVWERLWFPGLVLFMGMLSLLSIFSPRVSACFLQESNMM